MPLKLYYKNASETEWKTENMLNTTGSTYRATISAYEVTEEAIEYFITATDGVNTAICETAE